MKFWVFYKLYKIVLKQLEMHVLKFWVFYKLYKIVLKQLEVHVLKFRVFYKLYKIVLKQLELLCIGQGLCAVEAVRFLAVEVCLCPAVASEEEKGLPSLSPDETFYLFN